MRGTGRATMTETSSQTRPKLLRLHFLVERRMQLTLAFQILAVVAAVALTYGLAVYGLFDGLRVHAMTADHARGDFSRANLWYGSCAAILLIASVLALTHRVFAPAQVIEDAVGGMLKGEYDRRLTLLRGQLASSLEAGDVASARELLARLPGKPGADREV